MFEKIKEIIRESQAIVPVNSEFKLVCLDTEEQEKIVNTFRKVSQKVQCPHNMSHVLTFVVEMMKYSNKHSESKGVFVEAGCFKGGSTAKFSMVAKSLNRKLVVFDSFEGIPENAEDHQKSIFGYSIKRWFHKGSFSGSLEEVQLNVTTYGDISVCSFVKGWFDNTLPDLDIDIAGAYIDVDLASSTRTCIKYFYPRLLPGGFLVSQDGDFPLVIEVFDDDNFWEKEVGCKKPKIHGLNKSKMLKVYKEE